MTDEQFIKEADKILQEVVAYVQGAQGMKREPAAIFLLQLAKKYKGSSSETKGSVDK